jgi:hypothetical protein
MPGLQPWLPSVDAVAPAASRTLNRTVKVPGPHDPKASRVVVRVMTALDTADQLVV